MKAYRIIATLVIGAMLSVSPAMAQSRGGGSHGGGGGSRGGGVSHSSSSSMSHSSSSHSSGPSMSRSSSSSSHSSSSVSRPSSSRPSSSSVSRPSSSRPSSSSVSRSSSSRPSSSSVSRPSSSRPSSSSVSRPSSGRPSSSSVSRSAVSRPSSSATRTPMSGRSGSVSRQGTPSSTPSTSRPSAAPTKGDNGVNGGRVGNVNGGGDPQRPGGNGMQPGGQPGGHGMAGMPPSHHPMHPVFHDPYHHHMMHMHSVFWDPCPPRPLFWPGFWGYCNDYWYDYHTTNLVIVHDYAQNTYGIDMVSYAISGDLMYALVNESDGNTYMQVFDNQDKLLAEQKVSRKYNKCEIDQENGGCWIYKRGDKDPMLFIYSNGQFMIYEAD